MQTCSSCGATIVIFGDDDASTLCRSCRAGQGKTIERPFQRIGERRGRRLLGVRTAGLLVALAVVVATVVSLRGRGADPGDQAAPAAAPSRSRDRMLIGGHTVEIFVAPPPSSASGAGKPRD